jgi:hypothetical protein
MSTHITPPLNPLSNHTHTLCTLHTRVVSKQGSDQARSRFLFVCCYLMIRVHTHRFLSSSRVRVRFGALAFARTCLLRKKAETCSACALRASRLS